MLVNGAPGVPMAVWVKRSVPVWFFPPGSGLGMGDHAIPRGVVVVHSFSGCSTGGSRARSNLLN
jgi:hypothetical protein